MARTIVIGGGIAGQLAALLLAPDHEVVLLERDAAPPPEDPTAAWTGWDRRGVGQFRLLHYFLPRMRLLLEQEAPDVVKALDAAGALRTNPITAAPPEMTGGARDGDERFEALTARRPVFEAALSSVLAAAPGVTVRRGVGVAGLLAGEPVAGVPHVVGVRTEAGEELRADLVVDASGRRSPLPRWLDELGAGAPEEELEDSGFCYYGRYFRSADGSVPFAFGPPLMHHGSYSVLTLPADNGTWGVGITTMGDDAPMRALKDPEVWARLIAATPLVAHWADGEPIDDGVMIMAKLDDRHRRYVVDGRPVATGVLAVGDSWACTNPSVGRGATIGGLHAAALRDVLRDVGTADPLALALAFDAATQQVVEPLFRSTLHYDRHRLGAMRAAREGVPYEPGDPVWDLTCAMEQGASHDPDVLRAFVAVQSLVAQPEELLGDAALLERVIAVGTSEAAQEPLPGPDRAGVLEIVGAA